MPKKNVSHAFAVVHSSNSEIMQLTTPFMEGMNDVPKWKLIVGIFTFWTDAGICGKRTVHPNSKFY